METPKNKLLVHCLNNQLEMIRAVKQDAQDFRKMAETMLANGDDPDEVHEHCLKSLVDTCAEFMRQGYEAAKELRDDFDTEGEGLGLEKISEHRKTIRLSIHAAMLMDAGSHALSDMELESGRAIPSPSTP